MVKSVESAGGELYGEAVESAAEVFIEEVGTIPSYGIAPLLEGMAGDYGTDYSTDFTDTYDAEDSTIVSSTTASNGTTIISGSSSSINITTTSTQSSASGSASEASSTHKGSKTSSSSSESSSGSSSKVDTPQSGMGVQFAAVGYSAFFASVVLALF